MSKHVLLVTAAAFLATASVQAQAPGVPCSQFRVNTRIAGYQASQDVAARPDGSFVVVWQTDGPRDADIAGQRYDAMGQPQGTEFAVGSQTAGNQFTPALALTVDGGFVVSWLDQSSSAYEVVARRFDAAGAPKGPDFTVTPSAYPVVPLGVAGGPDGSFLVVWTGVDDGDTTGVYGRRFDAAGSPVGPEFLVNTSTTAYQSRPSVATNASGAFVVTWGKFQSDVDTGVYAQRYDASGTRVGPEFRVNTDTNTQTSSGGGGAIFAPRSTVAMTDDGDFVVVWQARQPQDPAITVLARAFDATGAPRGDQFQLSDPGPELTSTPSVVADSAGGFLTTWGYSDGDGGGVAARRLGPDGARGPTFPVNAHTAGSQGRARPAATPKGGFVITWSDTYGENGSSGGIFATLNCARFHTVVPCRLADTRDPAGPSGGPPLAANSTRAFPTAGLCGVPPDAQALVLNVTAVNPTDTGDLRLFPAGQAPPPSSTLNFVSGRTRANNATAMVGADGRVAIQCDMPAGSSGTTNLLLDVYGYYQLWQ
jgi:large repetitive protein